MDIDLNASVAVHGELTAQQEDALIAVKGVVATFSLVGSLIIVFALLRPGQQRGGLNLLVWLSGTDIIANIVSFMSIAITADNSNCVLVGFLVTFADLARVLWTACISVSLFINIFFSYRSNVKSADFFPIFCCVSFGVPLLLAIIAAANDSYGDSGFAQCWIKDTRERLYYFYLPLWIVLLFNSVVYFKIWWEYRRALRAHQGALGSSGSATSRAHRLKYYPAVLALAWSFGTVNRVAQAAGENLFSLLVLHHVFSNSQGILNFLVYGTDPTQQLYPLLRSWCCCGAPAAQLDDTEMESKDRFTQHSFPPPMISGEEFSDDDAPEAIKVGSSQGLRSATKTDSDVPSFANIIDDNDVFVDVDVNVS
eukprot:TRINITY_DN51262_c0_g1_i1.p1 TRINITY_DN51262_c0_g1~~TRINITY_DN51262_c0_g1_i1.p1  ORF type:complete len:376 (+),score=126.04 TRINITY_DN51262_c0_g1_i1:30-1130(+)